MCTTKQPSKRYSQLLLSLVVILLLSLVLTLPTPVQAAPALDSSVTKVGDANVGSLGPIVLPLSGGRIIKIGGQLSCADPNNCFSAGGSSAVEIFSPETNSWQVVAPLNQGRFGALGVVLQDGRIFVTGGYDSTAVIIGSNPYRDTKVCYYPTTISKIYDPVANTWQSVPPIYDWNLRDWASSSSITVLKDGRVFINRSKKETAIYNPATNAWTYSQSPVQGTVFPLDDGNALVLDEYGKPTIYDPIHDRWVSKAPASNNTNGYFMGFVRLNNWQILGVSSKETLSSQIYNIFADSWTAYPYTFPSGSILPLDPYPILAIQKYSTDWKISNNYFFYNLLTNTSTEAEAPYPANINDRRVHLGNGKILAQQGHDDIWGNQWMSAYQFYKDTYLYQYDIPTDLLISPAKLEISKTTNAVNFKWQDRATNEEGYLIERKATGTTAWQEVGRTTANATSFSDTNSPTATRLAYRVRAFKGSNFSLAVEIDKLQAGTLPVYRFYRLSNQTHFYTMDEKEKNTLLEKYASEMKYEGVAYNAQDLSSSDLVPVYRFYNSGKNAHFYTSNPVEKDALIANWKQVYLFEGIAFYAQATDANNAKAVYRFYNYQTKAHFYTSNPVEKDALIANWKQLYNYEGIAFYGF